VTVSWRRVVLKMWMIWSTGLISGVDLESQLIEKARNRAQSKGLQSQCEFILADHDSLPFPDSYFDLIKSPHLFRLALCDLGKLIS
jgi:ubiquinone/menaquinone biosynthesis C-methylase UbiE